MNINILDALIYSVIPTFIGLYVTEKVKGNLKSNFDKKLEKLKLEHSKDITQFQVEINALKIKENFKFTKLHEKRLIVLEKIYKLLNKASKELNDYVTLVKSVPQDTTFEDNENNLQNNYVIAHNKFVSYFNENKIFLNETVIGLIESYLIEVNEIYTDYSLNQTNIKTGGTFDNEIYIKAINASYQIPEKVTPIKKEIENKFREILEK